MTATAAQIAQVRRMVAEPTTDTYDDAAITTYIEAYPLVDERGEVPYTWDTSTSPPTQDDNDDWVDTYDLHAAAADIWDEKAATLSARFDVRVDSGSYSRSQAFEHALAQSRYHRARRKPSTHTLHMHPDPGDSIDPEWVINDAEED